MPFIQDSVEELVQRLNLLPHPEGGFYREMYRAPLELEVPILNGMRPAYTSIYFLLPGNSFSAWHKVASDESWFFHTGCPLSIYLMNALGQLEEHRVGFGDQLQMTVPANTWFAAKAHEESSFSLVSCTVAPGFDFADFELGRRQQLLDQFGDTEANRAIITQLTRQ
ncbi:hypothetical protein TUM22923_15780 [Polynucleobacter sp. TUM22923]|jgi:predicted cupin superfamily sugar epimerase|uniref:cupin domain-containing protein n=1 Tax=Polynucleobacter sp. TUM22923 TaxID=3022126 RepID=UPI002573A1E9|nr:cupin domain-containing protein [Polynucleobacter sp. TUM22923]BDX22257.1 hypothetical protein TUM22923_15780 [Polynucleobacter sp. TUM22923]